MNMTRAALQDSLGFRLLISRRDLDWNQDELSRRSGISRGHISKIERGDSQNITIDVAFALADALGVSRAYLIGLTEIVTSELDDKEEEAKFDNLTREFLNIYQQLSDDKKRTLLDLARMLRASDEPRIIGKEA